MKKNIFFMMIGCILLFTSCLKSGLDDIENSDLCAISSLTMEYRWISQNANNYDQLSRQQMTLSKNTPDENNEIRFTVTVPTVSTSFPKEIRDHVSLDGLYMITVISSAAKIQPLNGAPKLGVPGEFEIGKDYQYEVIAANGNRSVYHIVIEDFIK
ncbi:MAG: hypothetical protein Q4F50_01885 [Bacteroides sp.]|uniref:DUF5018-related domain-containing protein n=1 Tax=Bacteroides sp. TaxID=29523 RepID=UPI0026E0B4EB|nr:hypothetical protein [Bacteroides sp.]MDO5418805.1 hypothetical protein [Bacteroides sp.]